MSLQRGRAFPLRLGPEHLRGAQSLIKRNRAININQSFQSFRLHAHRHDMSNLEGVEVTPFAFSLQGQARSKCTVHVRATLRSKWEKCLWLSWHHFAAQIESWRDQVLRGQSEHAHYSVRSWKDDFIDSLASVSKEFLLRNFKSKTWLVFDTGTAAVQVVVDVLASPSGLSELVWTWVSFSISQLSTLLAPHC